MYAKSRFERCSPEDCPDGRDWPVLPAAGLFKVSASFVIKLMQLRMAEQ